MLYGFNWGIILVYFIIIWLIVLITVLIGRTSLSLTIKHFINIAAIILVFLIALNIFGYRLSIIFRIIEWATKFVLPWIALYWLIRAIKVLDKKS